MKSIDRFVAYCLSGAKNEFDNRLAAEDFSRNNEGGFIEHYLWRVGTPGSWELIDSQYVELATV